ncbi:MAG: DUF1638 domain-containing protein [Desulfobacterales bacterium]|nr:DUF1638 domain-containing protein [Desulfobacterales bacterium]
MDYNNHQKPLLISCGILQPEIEALIARQEIEADVVFLNKYLHVDYQKLYRTLKASMLRHRQRNPVVIYGDMCLGFNGEMQTLMAECDVIKVDALNCIDCLLGGRGKLLEMDPDHRLFFLTPAFMAFSENLITGTKTENQQRFKMLKGIILIDSLGDMEQHLDRVEHFSEQTALPVLEHLKVGLTGLRAVIEKALERRHNDKVA